MKEDELLAWIDIETTGLDPLEDKLLEVACIVTTQSLEEINRDEWQLKFTGQDASNRFDHAREPIPHIVYQMHKESGLWSDCGRSDLLEHEWVEEFEEFLQDCLNVNDWATKFVMAGSGVARFDYTWFQFNYQRLLEKFTYYCFDVGVIRRGLVLVDLIESLENKTLAHRAMMDIEDHIEEWKYYKGLITLGSKDGQWEAWTPNAWRFDNSNDSE